MIVIYDLNRIVGRVCRGELQADIEADSKAFWCPEHKWLIKMRNVSVRGVRGRGSSPVSALPGAVAKAIEDIFGVLGRPGWWPQEPQPTVTKASLQSYAIRLAVEDAMTWERYVSGVFAEHAPKEDVSWEPEPSLALWKPIGH